MKVIAINGSPRKDGNTSIIINTVFNELNSHGIETEIIQLGGNLIKGCTGCGRCFKVKDRKCGIQDDLVNDIIQKLSEADGVILGSPVYFADISPELKAFIERAGMVASANDNLFKHKIGASVMAVRRGGAIHAFDTMNHFLHYMQMYLVGASYWNMVYGREIGEVQNDDEGITNMKILGQNMAWILSKINDSPVI